MRVRFLAATILAAVFGCGSASAASPQTVASDDYGFRVTFPATQRICWALSGEHLHGYYAWYGANAKCQRADVPEHISAISIYGDFNMSGDLTPLEAMDGWCDPKAMRHPDIGANLKALNIPGKKTAVCAEEKGNDITVVVVAQSNARDMQDRGDTTVLAPRANYYMVLSSPRKTLRRNVARFTGFLSSVRFSEKF